ARRPEEAGGHAEREGGREGQPGRLADRGEGFLLDQRRPARSPLVTRSATARRPAMFRLRIISPEALLLLAAISLGSCQKSKADLSGEQAQKRAGYALKKAQLDQQEAAAQAAVHRDAFEKKVQAWGDVAESQVKAN